MNSTRFGTVYRYDNRAQFDQLRQTRAQKAIPVAYVGQDMLNNPIGEAYRVGNYVINDDCGYPPPDGTPGYAFTATDAMWAVPQVGKLRHLVNLQRAYSQPRAYVTEQRRLGAALNLNSYSGYDGEPAFSPERQKKLSMLVSDLAKEEAGETAASLQQRIQKTRVRTLG